MQMLENYIGGELVEPIQGKYIDNVEPSTGKIYSQTPDSTAEDLERAVEAATKAQPAWAGLSLEERATILTKVANTIDDHSNELAKAEAVDNGKPFSLAKSVDIYRSSANIRFFAQAITQFSSESHAMGNVAINYTLRDPIGVVGCISPWNLPL